MSEEAFQRWVRSLPWFEEFLRRYGEEPDLDTRDYDYRSAFRAGLAPSRHRDGAYHWPSVTPNGLMLKGEGHPTRWKEEFVSRTGMDPDDFLEYPGEFARGGSAASRNKVRKVMGEFKRGKLHSGSKSGPIVRDRDQAIAIALSEARVPRRAEGGPVYLSEGGGLSRRGILGAIAAAAAGAAAKKGKGLIDNAAPAAERATAKAGAQVGKDITHVLEHGPANMRDELLEYLYRRAHGETSDSALNDVLDPFLDSYRDFGPEAGIDDMRKKFRGYEDTLKREVQNPHVSYWATRFNPYYEDGMRSLTDSELDDIMKSLGYPTKEAMAAGKYKEIRPEHLIGDPAMAETLKGYAVEGKPVYDRIQDMLTEYYSDLYGVRK